MSESEEVAQSFGRCTLKGDVIGRFYEIFMDSHPDVRPRFSGTDFASQKQLLRQGIGLATMFAGDNPVGKNGIDRITKSHGRSGLDVPPHLYLYWKRSLIQAVSEFDGEFSDELKTRWDRVLQKTIDHISAGYEN